MIVVLLILKQSELVFERVAKLLVILEPSDFRFRIAVNYAVGNNFATLFLVYQVVVKFNGWRDLKQKNKSYPI
jgi:hypothetical protein